MRYWHGHGHVVGGWGMGLMAFGTLLLLVIAVLLAVALFRYFSRSRQPIPPGRGAPGTGGSGAGGPQGWGQAGQGSLGGWGTPPEQLLAERFARGEIDAEEYRHRLETLRSANRPGGD
ncbi:SHOCT domain-containing protein [Kitasatospora sp. NPDC127067]|uniref:SHOCT domain-containing protein n=1 Tax=Kitasatospora sp. NPDC127067 TaxID=3347126 RepID=UPI00365C85F0